MARIKVKSRVSFFMKSFYAIILRKFQRILSTRHNRSVPPALAGGEEPGFTQLYFLSAPYHPLTQVVLTCYGPREDTLDLNQ